MRKFTKDHNEIEWLFPNVTGFDEPEQRFDEFEKIGINLLSYGYSDQETFTRDDMMDAFMKGASVMNQLLGESIIQQYQCSSSDDEITRLRVDNKLLKEILTKLLTNRNKKEE